MSDVMKQEMGTIRVRTFWILSSALDEQAVEVISTRVVEHGDYAVVCDGSAHVYGVDHASCFRALETAAVDLGFAVSWSNRVPDIGFVGLPLAHVVWALTDWRALPAEPSAAGCVGCLWTPDGVISGVLRKLAPRLFADLGEPMRALDFDGHRRAMGGS